MESTVLNFDKLPRATEIEASVIISLIVIGKHDDSEAQQAMLRLTEDCFFNKNTREIFQIIKTLFHKKQLFDAVSLLSIVKDDVYLFLSELITHGLCHFKHWLNDVDKLISYRILREQLLLLSNITNQALESPIVEDSLAIIAEGLKEITSTANPVRVNNKKSYEQIIEEILIEENENNLTIPVDIPNFPEVPKNSLITIAGRSGHGKTFFAIYLMDKLIESLPDSQNLYFNLEMAERVMIERHARLLGFKGYGKVLMKNSSPILLEKNVSLISVPMITIDEIETECRLSSLQKPLGVVVVDYLGLIRSKTKSERKDLEQSDIAKRLAALALELNCVVIGLIQVNRDFKNRPVGERVPQVSDSAESMGSVHSATWWLGIDQPQKDSMEPEFKDLFQIACRKNRHGNTFFVELEFRDERFFEYHRRYSDLPRLAPFVPENF